MGGLAGGRVRARNSRGIPKKKSCILSTDPALRVITLQWEIAVNWVSETIAKVDHKSEDISGSVCSIDSGAIFPPRSGQDLSRNVFVVSIYAF